MKKNILFVVPSFRLATKELVCSIANQGSEKFQVHVITFDENTDEFDAPGTLHLYPTNNGYKSMFGKAMLAWKRARYINKFAEEQNIDTIVGFFKQAAVPTVMSNVLSTTHRKTIASIRNNPFVKFQTTVGKFSSFVYRFADQIVTNSKAAKLICQENFGLRNVTSIQNIVNYSEIYRKSQANIPGEYKSLFQDNQVFINIGRLAPQKGQWHLIRAFKKVLQANQEVKLLILGEGTYREKLQKLIKSSNISNHVFLPGFQENVYPFLKEADCFVLSSLHEGLPNVVLEAKTVGTPVISTDCHTGPREILAPELPLNSTISYPHRSGKHTLVKRLSGDEIWKTPNEHALEPSEKMLTEVMLNELSRETPVKRFTRDERFEMDKIIKEWEQIL